MGSWACQVGPTPYPTVCLKHETTDGSIQEFCIEDTPAPTQEPYPWIREEAERFGWEYNQPYFVYIYLNPEVKDAKRQVLEFLGRGEVRAEELLIIEDGKEIGTSLGREYISAGISLREARHLSEMEAVAGMRWLQPAEPDADIP